MDGMRAAGKNSAVHAHRLTAAAAAAGSGRVHNAVRRGCREDGTQLRRGELLQAEHGRDRRYDSGWVIDSVVRVKETGDGSGRSPRVDRRRIEVQPEVVSHPAPLAICRGGTW